MSSSSSTTAGAIPFGKACGAWGRCQGIDDGTTEDRGGRVMAVMVMALLPVATRSEIPKS